MWRTDKPDGEILYEMRAETILGGYIIQGDKMENISEKIMIVVLLIIAFFYFKLYHSLFRVIYFGNMFIQMIFEFIGCILLAAITVGAVVAISKFLFGIVGGVFVFLLKAIFILAVIIGMVVIIGFIIKLVRGRED